MIQELGDIHPLSTLPKLKMLSLLHSPVTHKQHYRKYVIFKIPTLKVLDFKKVKVQVNLLLPVQNVQKSEFHFTNFI